MIINQEHKIKGNTNIWKSNMMMKRQRLYFLTKIVFINLKPKVMDMDYGEERILDTNALSQATKAS